MLNKQINEEREYKKAFDAWYNEGNRVLKIDDTVFILTERNPIYSDDYYCYVCDSKDTYALGWVKPFQMGELITKKKITYVIFHFRLRSMVLKDFIDVLIKADYNYGKTLYSVFSFSNIDLSILPERIIKGLVIAKLSQ